jgi:hypothetical protein
VEADCAGMLTATVRPGQRKSATEIVCDRDGAHRWPARDWLRLGHQIEQARPGPVRRAVRWLSAPDIARLQQVAPGSVYRLASERQWRRQTRSGRTHYHEDDVAESFRRDGATG